MLTFGFRPTRWVVLVLALAAACATASRAPRASSPQAAVDELIAADRGFAAAAENGDPIAKIASMLADDAMMPTPRGTFARSRAEAADALRAALGSARTRVEWSPVRGGISADGQHGFTFGYMMLAGPDTASIPLKYLSYWVREAEGWRVAAYRLARRAPGPVAASMMPPSLPGRWVPPNADTEATAAHRASLITAERAFSDRAQVIGLGPAFATGDWEVDRSGSAAADEPRVVGRGPGDRSVERRPGRDVRGDPAQRASAERDRPGRVPLFHRVASRLAGRALAVHRGVIGLTIGQVDLSVSCAATA